MSNFGTRQDPDPTPFGEKHPCFCMHYAEISISANEKRSGNITWNITLREDVLCSDKPVVATDWETFSKGNLRQNLAIYWRFKKACGNCKKEPCGGFHTLTDLDIGGIDEPTATTPSPVQVFLSFATGYGKDPTSNISPAERKIILAHIQAMLATMDPPVKDPAKKSCAEVSSWCKEN